MRVLAIDPGTTQSAWCLLADDGTPEAFGIALNTSILSNLPQCFGYDADICVIEMVASYGKPVGQETFRTVWWTGRFADAWFRRYGTLPMELFRTDVKMHLCHATSKINDAIIRRRLIDIYGGEGGEAKAIGKKASPGPCYGMTKDVWQACAVAVTAQARFNTRAAA